ncbi:MAG: type II CAAX prenyl endopeptidase Rce1 family protein [Anaerolineales bacterium]
MEAKTAPSHTNRDLAVYFIVAYAISWAIAVPLALAHQGIVAPILPPWFHYLVGYGPMLSALLVTWATRGQDGVKTLWLRLTNLQIGAIWWLIALSPLIIGLVVALGMNLLGGGNISLAQLGEVHFLPPLGIGALFLWLFTFGIGEEMGWRGFALPSLQRGHNALTATAILASLWALWHLPQFFYLFDPSIAIGWAIGLFAGAIVFTWLLNSTEGSILVVAVWHGCFNYITASSAGNGVLAAVVSTVVMVWAVVVVFLYKPRNLSPKARFRL